MTDKIDAPVDVGVIVDVMAGVEGSCATMVVADVRLAAAVDVGKADDTGCTARGVKWSVKLML
jgi:hypothetical protein